MVRKYDTTFIIDGSLSEAQRQAMIERIFIRFGFVAKFRFHDRHVRLP